MDPFVEPVVGLRDQWYSIFSGAMSTAELVSRRVSCKYAARHSRRRSLPEVVLRIERGVMRTTPPRTSPNSMLIALRIVLAAASISVRRGFSSRTCKVCAESRL